MIEKIECTCIEAYTTRKMRDPNCCACSCDHNDLVEQLAKANERVKELEAAVATAIHTFNKYEMDVDMYPTIEHVKMKNGLHECLNKNKFAIEKKIEGYIRGFVSGYQQASDDIESGNWTDDNESLLAYACDFSEQLRKEQNQC